MTVPTSILETKSPRELANFLGIEYNKYIVYFLYRKPLSSQYKKFEILKRGSGKRKISAPTSSLKFIQQKLAAELAKEFHSNTSSHAYQNNKSIKTNAAPHVNAHYILNIDLEDFFGSINFGRVRGMFMSRPYYATPAVATVMAQICCFENALPQGAPTSPVVSNMICSKMDSHLRALAKATGCYYTRYADDITFSKRGRKFPDRLATVVENDSEMTCIVGKDILNIVSDNGFKINEEKTRFTRNGMRHEVTGLVVNSKLNVRRSFIRQIQAMLRAWDKFGYENAADHHFNRYRRKTPGPGHENASFEKVVRGKIQHVGSVKGQTDAVYLNLAKRFNAIASQSIDLVNDSVIKLANEATFVIENEKYEGENGTAFYMSGVGFITCFHCTSDYEQVLYRPKYMKEKIRVKRKFYNDEKDLAILEPIDAVTIEESYKKTQHQVCYGDKITLVGYPEHGPGKKITIKDGHVTSFGQYIGQSYIKISQPIVGGNSGGPLLDSYGRVVAVAQRGLGTTGKAANVEFFGAIPVNAVMDLFEKEQKVIKHPEKISKKT